jgi:acylphosphatase
VNYNIIDQNDRRIGLKARRFLISGRVQGVAFRYFTERVACSLNISGWVRNLYNGDVEALAQGTDESLEIFYSKMKDGPPAARVSNVQIADVPVDPDIKGFKITY